MVSTSLALPAQNGHVHSAVSMRLYRSCMIGRFVIGTLLTAVAMQAQISRPWTVRYSRTGGIAGINERATLTDSGRLIVSSRGAQSTSAPLAIGADQIAEVESALANLHLAGAPTPLPQKPSYPDMMTITLDVTIEGRTYPIAPESAGAGPLLAIMGALYSEGQQHADDEYWARIGPFNPG